MRHDHASYRDRVTEVRAEARSLLERLRAERLAKSRFARPAPAVTVVPAAVPAPPDRAQVDAWIGPVEPGPASVARDVPRAVPAAAKIARKASTPAKLRVTKTVAKVAPADAIEMVAPAPALQVMPKPVRATRAKPQALPTSDPAPAVPVTPLASVAEPAPAIAPSAPVRKARKAEAVVVQAAPAPVNVMPAPPPVPVAPMAAPADSTADKNGRAKAVRAEPARTKPARAAVAPAKTQSVMPKPARQPAPPVRAAVAAPTAMPEPSPRPAGLSVAALPGIGAGLVWRLEQAGYKTLDDVAQAHVDELASQLGAVGRLIKLDRWIAFARGQGDSAA